MNKFTEKKQRAIKRKAVAKKVGIFTLQFIVTLMETFTK